MRLAANRHSMPKEMQPRLDPRQPHQTDCHNLAPRVDRVNMPLRNFAASVQVQVHLCFRSAPPGEIPNHRSDLNTQLERADSRPSAVDQTSNPLKLNRPRLAKFDR